MRAVTAPQCPIFLTELSFSLAASNLAVLERFAMRRHALDALPLKRVEELQAALHSLNLEHARQLCESQINTLAAD